MKTKKIKKQKEMSRAQYERFLLGDDSTGAPSQAVGRSSSKHTGQVVAFLILLATVVSCALFFQPSEAAAREIDTIIVHHTDSGDVSVKTINEWHKERGWSGIGYHYVIRANGDLEIGRPVSKIGAHAKGRNAHSIGIALTGRDHFTWQQKISLGILVRKLCKKYPIKKIERHHERCPGPNLEVEAMAKEVLGNVR